MDNDVRKDGNVAGQADGAGIRTSAEEEARLAELAGGEPGTKPAEKPEGEEGVSDEPMPIKDRTFASRQERKEYERSEARIEELSKMNGLSYEANDYLENAFFGYDITNDFLETIKKPDFEAVVRQVLSQGEAQMPLNEKLCFQSVEVIELITRIARSDRYRKNKLGEHFDAARGESDFDGYLAAKERLAMYPEPTLKAAIEDGEKQAAHDEDDIRRDQERISTLLEAMAMDIKAIKSHEQTISITVVREDDYKSDKTIGLYSLLQGMGVFASKADYEKLHGLIFPKSKSTG